MIKTNCFKIFSAFALLIVSALSHNAQTQTAVTGTVKDGAGAAVVGAAVELKNASDSKGRTQITDSNGQFSFSPVSQGEYKIIVTMKGFRQMTIASVKANEAKNYDFDVELQTGEISETVVVTGTRSEQEIGKIASAISVISQDAIQDGQRVSTLEESLKRVPGVRVEDELGGNGARVRIIIRGTGTRANSPAGSGVRGVKVLVDGIPKNNAGGSAQDLVNIDLQSAARIEVLKGPSSVLYGNQSGGVVNILTQNPPQTKFSIGYRQTFGAFGLFKEHLRGGGQYGKFGFYASGFRNDQKGYRVNSKFYNTGFNAKLNFTPNNRSNLMIILGYDHNYQQSPGPLTEAQFRLNPRQADPTFITNAVFAVVKEFRFGAVYHTELFGQDDLEVTGFIIPRDLGPFQQIGVFIAQQFVNRGFNVRYLNQRKLGDFGNRFTVGVEYQNTPIRTITTSRVTNRVTSDLDEHANTAGAYLLEEFSILPNVTITVGGRYDYVSFRSQNLALNTAKVGRIFRRFTPKIGIAYQPTENVSLYANYSRGFETPIIGELRILPGGAFGFNLNLGPQSSTNYEVGVRGNFLKQRVKFDVAFFRQNVKDFISPFGTSPNNSFQNVGDVKENGVELSVVAAILPRLTLTSTYGYSDFVFTRYNNGISNFTGNRLPGVPKHSFFNELRYDSKYGVFGAIENQYVGKFFTNDGNLFSNPPYSVTNLRFGYKKTEGGGKVRFEPFIGINNIFDRRYSAFAIINDAARRFYNPLPGINVYGGFGISFQ